MNKETNLGKESTESKTNYDHSRSTALATCSVHGSVRDNRIHSSLVYTVSCSCAVSFSNY